MVQAAEYITSAHDSLGHHCKPLLAIFLQSASIDRNSNSGSMSELRSGLGHGPGLGLVRGLPYLA